MIARDHPLGAVAVAAVVSGLASALVVAVPGSSGHHLGGGFARDQVTIYGPAHAVLAVALAVTGLLLALSRSRTQVIGCLGVIGLCSSQLAGVGLVGNRRWPLYWGCCADRPVKHEELLHTSAFLMGLVCAATAIACLVVLRRQRLLEWQGWTAGVALPIGLVVLVAVPWIMATSTRYVSGDTSDVGAAALTYAIPFAAALVASAFMSRGAAFVVAAAVAGSALIATLGRPFLDTILPFHDAQMLVVGAAVVVGVARMVPRPVRRQEAPA